MKALHRLLGAEEDFTAVFELSGRRGRARLDPSVPKHILSFDPTEEDPQTILVEVERGDVEELVHWLEQLPQPTS